MFMDEIDLLAEKGYNCGWPAIQQTTRSGSGASMMDHGRHMLEEPSMWTITDVIDVVISWSSQLAPAL
jgi:hypothetical protein